MPWYLWILAWFGVGFLYACSSQFCFWWAVSEEEKKENEEKGEEWGLDAGVYRTMIFLGVFSAIFAIPFLVATIFATIQCGGRPTKEFNESTSSGQNF